MRDRSTQRKLPGASARHLDLNAQAGGSCRASVRPYDGPFGTERSFRKATFGFLVELRFKSRVIAAMLLPLCRVTTELHLKNIAWRFVPLSVNPFPPPKTY